MPVPGKLFSCLANRNTYLISQLEVKRRAGSLLFSSKAPDVFTGSSVVVVVLHTPIRRHPDHLDRPLNTAFHPVTEFLNMSVGGGAGLGIT